MTDCLNSPLPCLGKAGGIVCRSNSSKQLNVTNFSRKRLAFTLTEVLITLGIIGVVAAITIPGLITKYEKKVAVDRVKKVYAVLQNATTSSIQDNGPVSTWDWSLSGYDFLDKYYFPYMKKVDVYNKSTPNVVDAGNNKLSFNYQTAFYTADGIIFYYNHASWKGTFVFDINGNKKPNRTARDIFAFRLFSNPEPGKICGYHNASCQSNRNGGLNYNGSMGQCSKGARGGIIGAGSTCSQTLLYYGWEMPNNYPW